MIIILSNGKLEFECYIVRFNSNFFLIYFLLVYFSSCVIRFRIDIQSWIHILYSDFWANFFHFVKKNSKQNILSKIPYLKKKQWKMKKLCKTCPQLPII